MNRRPSSGAGGIRLEGGAFPGPVFHLNALIRSVEMVEERDSGQAGPGVAEAIRAAGPPRRREGRE